MPNGPEFIQLFLAITMVGAAAAPLNPAYTHGEFVFYLTDIAPKLMLVPASRPAAAISAAEERSLTVLTVQPGHDGPPALFVSEYEVDSKADFAVGQPDDVAVVLHTSGTTSRPKQVPLRQRNLMATVRTIGAALPARVGRRLVLRDAAVPRARAGRLDPRDAGSGRYGRRAAPVHAAAVLAAGSRARRNLVLGRTDAAPDDPGRAVDDGGAPDHAALRPLVQFGAVAGAAGAGRGGLRRADARGLRHDRGQPPDGLQPAAARGPGAGSVGVRDRHRDRASRPQDGPCCRKGRPARW